MSSPEVSASSPGPGQESTDPTKELAKWRRGNLIVGGLLVSMVILTALISFVWTPHDYLHIDVSNRLLGPSTDHVLGTDQFGRDILTMLMVGSRNTLLVGIVSVSIALTVGVACGGVAVINRGWLEEGFMRGADVLYALPPVLGAMVLQATLGPGNTSAMIAIALFYVPVFLRVSRAAGLQAWERQFVTAALAYGRTRTHIFWRHILPNISSTLIVQASIMFGLAILIEAALAYLGLGAQPPTPSWGGMLRESQSYMTTAPLLAVWPGTAIMLAVVGFNLLGDGLRDALDTKLVRRV